MPLESILTFNRPKASNKSLKCVKTHLITIGEYMHVRMAFATKSQKEVRLQEIKSWFEENKPTERVLQNSLLEMFGKDDTTLFALHELAKTILRKVYVLGETESDTLESDDDYLVGFYFKRDQHSSKS